MYTMKQILKNTWMMIVVLISLLACNDDFLNTQPLNEVVTERVWKDASLAQAFVTDI